MPKPGLPTAGYSPEVSTWPRSSRTSLENASREMHALTSILISINRRYKVPASGLRITGVPRPGVA